MPPPTLDDPSYGALRPLAEGEEDDGQYREDPSIYWKDERYNRPAAPAVKQTVAPRPQYYQPAVQQQQYEQPQYQAQQYQAPQQQYQAPQHRFTYTQPRSYYQPPAQSQPQPQPGYDINTGSYTISYTG